MRCVVLIGACGILLSACAPKSRTAAETREISQHIISLEKAALDRWIHLDPDGYLALYAKDASYFDPFRPHRIDGLDSLSAQLGPMRGMKLPFSEVRYEMIDPVVRLEGNIAVLTFNMANFGKVPNNPQEFALSRWNATEIYQEVDGAWKITHAHWSFTQPRLAGAPGR